METVVLVLTDVQGSTRLWHDEPVAMDAAMARHHEIVHGAVAENGGWRPVDQGEGDAVFAAFRSAREALAAVVRVQRELAAEPWPTSVPLKVRIGVHVGEVTERSGNLFGDPVNRCARIRGLGWGGQVLLSAAVHALVGDRLPAGVSMSDLGEHRMKDLSRPERVWQLTGEGLDGPFPPLASLDRVRHNLPLQLSSFVGREDDIRQVISLVREHRLVTLTGAGGMGKTRLALQTAAELADGSLGDVWLVDLVAVDDPALVPARIAEVIGVQWGKGDAGRALIVALKEASTLLVLDNLEQVLGCAPLLADLLTHTESVRILTTSREPLRVRGEYQFGVAPLSLPSTQVGSQALSAYAAVQLFVERAVAVRPDFVVDNRTAPGVAAICAKLDGHPLALELAAARLKMLSVEQLLARLDSALSVLTGGSRDMPARHQTLRATIAWSFDSLSRDEQLLLTRMSVLPAPASFEMVEDVCGKELDVLDLLAGLVDKSLITVTELDDKTRYGLLVSIREYAAEQLDPATMGELQNRHADHIQGALTAFNEFVNEEYRQLHAYVDRELTHARVAVAHRRSMGPAGTFASLVAALSDTLIHRGQIKESLELARAALPDTDDPERRCTLLIVEWVASLLSGAPQRGTAELIEAARCCPNPARRANGLLAALGSTHTKGEFQELLDDVDRTIHLMPALEAPLMLADRNGVVARTLRFADPDAAEQAARSPDDTGAGLQLILSYVLLDRGDWEQALSVQATRGDVSYTSVDSPTWTSRGGAARAEALIQAGRLDQAREVVMVALDAESSTGAPPLFSTIPLVDLERAASHPETALRTAEDLLAALPGDTGACGRPVNADEDWHVVSLRWRRAVCLRQVGHLDQSAAELAACREYFAASELFGPRELLGILVERAVQVADTDPARAAMLLASVQAHRGRWVLPFGMDADLQGLLPRLPAHEGAPPHPTAAW